MAALPWVGARFLWRLLPRAEEIRGKGLLSRLLGRAAAMLAQVRLLLRDPALLAVWASMSLVMFALIAAQYWLLSRAVGASVGIDDTWIALGVSTFAGVAALIPLGLGVLDGSLAAALDRLGATSSRAARGGARPGHRHLAV